MGQGAEEEPAARDLPCGTAIRRAGAVTDRDSRGDAVAGIRISIGGRKHPPLPQSAGFAGLLGGGADGAFQRRYHARRSAQSEESKPGADAIHAGCAALGRFFSPVGTILPGTRPAQRVWTSAHRDSAKDLRDDAQDAALQHPYRWKEEELYQKKLKDWTKNSGAQEESKIPA